MTEMNRIVRLELALSCLLAWGERLLCGGQLTGDQQREFVQLVYQIKQVLNAKDQA